MKKQIQIKKLVLSKKVIGNLTEISGGRPPKTWRYCDSVSGGGGDTNDTIYSELVC
jgi:hypothetical protein